MSSPVYFLAGARRDMLIDAQDRLRAEGLARYRLREVLSDCESIDQVSVSELNTHGPDKKSGVILCAQSATGRLPNKTGFYPNDQNWRRVEDSDLYIGLDKHEAVTPADLQRLGTRVSPDGTPAPRFAGHYVKLTDGQEWEFPIVRRPGKDGRTNLPRTFHRLGGEFSQVIDPRYLAIWEQTSLACHVFFNSEANDRIVDLEWAVDLCVQALALNYRFSWDLQNILGLIDSTNWEQCLASLVDLPLFLELAAQQKKSALPSSASVSPEPSTPTSVGSVDT